MERGVLFEPDVLAGDGLGVVGEVIEEGPFGESGDEEGGFWSWSWFDFGAGFMEVFDAVVGDGSESWGEIGSGNAGGEGEEG
jgi:hypothetical protein